MENVYLKMSVEMGLKGWGEQFNVVSDKECRAVWKKKGDVGEWVFLLENIEGKDKMLCAMSLKAGKEFAAKMEVQTDMMMAMDVGDILASCKGAIERMLHKSTGGGYICQKL